MGEELRLTTNHIKKQQIKLFSEKKSGVAAKLSQHPKGGIAATNNRVPITRYLQEEEKKRAA